jgi:hypothetical protein
MSVGFRGLENILDEWTECLFDFCLPHQNV